MKQVDRIAEKNLVVSVAANGMPPCFNSKKEYNEWIRHETVCHTLAFRKNVCEDCTSRYKTDMILKNRCVNIHIVVTD